MHYGGFPETDLIKVEDDVETGAGISNNTPHTPQRHTFSIEQPPSRPGGLYFSHTCSLVHVLVLQHTSVSAGALVVGITVSEAKRNVCCLAAETPQDVPLIKVHWGVKPANSTDPQW